ncbi:hypothetical protein PORY_002165 [Pneumocystis oryctolagi]|uniref:Uncharacterized protein n=1 Tax=Pneumocystis oryctolagi TaxID=42067 RepID=A0ACB7CAQ1_9ASCO|nr:hypothetical protein PORY_002165 [Pneumocystis oryctolagi]
MALDKDENDSNTSIFVRKVPFHVSSASFSSFFSEIAPVKHAMIVTDSEMKTSKGYGFVSFSTHADAKKAICELKKRSLDGHFLKAEFAKRRHRNDKKDTLKEHKEAEGVSKKLLRPFLIVRNLPWSVRKKDDAFFLKFRKYGKVINVIIPRKKGGKMSGFAFVHMKKMSAAENAIKNINGVELNGRQVAVDWALSQDEWKSFLEKEKKNHEDTSFHSEPSLLEEKDIISCAGSENEINSQDLSIIEEKQGISDVPNDDNEKTLFVKNLSSETTNNILFSHFRQFGSLKYARVVIDSFTGKAKGTAFVCFHNKADMENCLKMYQNILQQSDLVSKKSSILVQNEMINDNAKKFILDGHLLSVFPSLHKKNISEVENSNRKEGKYILKKNFDKRNLFLLNEGYIDSKSPLFNLLSETELSMRNQSLTQRKKLLEKNPSLYISLTRLAVRNIPKDISDKELKALAREACVNFAKEVRENKRMPLTREEKLRDGNPKKGKKGIVRQAKILQEKNGEKRGCGFIEYVGHRWALMGLRWLNGRKISSKKNENIKKSLIVEFALENINVVNRRKERENRDKKKVQSRIDDKILKESEKKRNRDESSDLSEAEDKKRIRLSYIISRKRRERKARRR